MAVDRGNWWQRPQLRTDAEEHRERRVTWLELFFDLVFVVVIAELSHSLAEHVNWEGVLAFILLFLPVWWVWIGATFYNDRFETPDVSYRILTFLQMVLVAPLAIFAHNGLGETSIAFALSYVAVRLLLIFMWLRGGWHVPAFRPVSNRYAIGFSISVLLFITSIFVPPPWRFGLWGAGLLIDLVTPMTTLHFQARLPRLTREKMVERFGLFTIIVLGEAVVGVVRGVAENHELSLATGLEGILGLALAFGLWWIYFDFIARREPRAGVWWFLTWGYLHLPLLMALTAAGAGVLNLLTAEEAVLEPNIRWLITGATTVALMVMGLLELTLHRDADEPTHYRLSSALKVGGGLGALGLGLWGGSLSPAGLLAVLLLFLLLQMVYGAYVWFRRPLVEPAAIE